MTPLCLADHCGIRGRHLPDCQRCEVDHAHEPECVDCGGCLPRRAADGLRLCDLHTRLIAEDATTAAELHAELALALTSPEGWNERTSGSPDRTRIPNPRAVAARTEIRHVLVAWSRLIAEERGLSLPADTIEAIGAYVSRHAVWLAASAYADEASTELRDLVRRSHPVAFPSGARVFPVAPCPHEGCAGEIRVILRRTDSLLPSELVCDQDEEHCWTADQWLTLGRKLRRAA